MDRDKRLKRKGLVLLGLSVLIGLAMIGAFLLSIYTEAMVLFALLFVAGFIAEIVVLLMTTLVYTQMKLHSPIKEVSSKEK